MSPAREEGDARAEALVASFDGLLIAALQKPHANAERSCRVPALVMHALPGGVTAPTSWWNGFSSRLGHA